MCKCASALPIEEHGKWVKMPCLLKHRGGGANLIILCPPKPSEGVTHLII